MNILNLINGMKILYVENDIAVKNEIVNLLECFNVTVYAASNGQEGLDLFANHRVDLIISDIEMPKMDGIEFVEHIRKVDKKVAIMMLTAYCKTDYLYQCANLSIQAYLLKPINYTKLQEAFEKIIEYLDLNASNPIFNITKNLSYNIETGTFAISNKIIQLKRKEMLLMNFLIENRNKIVTYEEIERVVWNVTDEVMTSNALRTIVKNLRKHCEDNFIQNVSGIGYKLIEF